MSLGDLNPIKPVATLTKYLLIGIIAIVIIVVFFVNYSSFVIPLVMVAVIAAFLFITPAGRNGPVWQSLLFISLAFFLTYAIQKLSVNPLSTTFGVSTSIGGLIAGLISVLISGIVLMGLITIMLQKSRHRKA